MELCRICGKSYVNKSPMLKLFDMRIKHLLQYIKIFTGLLLTRKNVMPEYICDTCLQDLERAIKFRKRCIETQKKLSRNYNVNSVRRNEKTACGTGDSVISLTIERIPEWPDEFINIKTLDETVNNFVEELNEEESAYEQLSEIEYETINTGCDKSVTETMLQEESSAAVQETYKKNIKKIVGPVVCEFCGKSFNFVGNFREHQLRHSGIKKFNCHLCTFKFCTNKELVRHMRRHTGERPYACTYCDSRFADLSTRAQHERRHMDERHFKCEKCNKSFVTSGCLKKHMLTHTGIRTHFCSVCNQWFLRRTHLSTHLRSKGHIQNLANHEISNNEKQEEII